MNTIQTATLYAAGLKADPSGRIGVVSIPGAPNVLDQFAKATTTFFQSTVGGIINAGEYILNPQAILGPGPVSNAVIKTANTATSAINETKKSVVTGVETGFKYATLILLLVVGLWAWSVIKPRG